jgi:uncharacterized membrane protein YqaE (UPF0057 family)
VPYLLCILAPPAAVYATDSKSAVHLNLILTLGLWLPGVLHAFLIVHKNEENKRNQKLIHALEEVSKVQPRSRANFSFEQGESRRIWEQ